MALVTFGVLAAVVYFLWTPDLFNWARALVLCTLLSVTHRVRSLSPHPFTTPGAKETSTFMFGKSSEDPIAQFCGITGASTKDAKKFLERYKRVDVAIDAFYNDPKMFSTPPPPPSSLRSQAVSSIPSTAKLNALFGKYKDPDSDQITVDGTIRLCQDLGVDPEDVVLLAVAFELKSQRLGEWNRQGWTDGWKSLGCDTIQAMQGALPRLKERLGRDPKYFKQVYAHTFDFARSEGQRSLGAESAQAFWALLIPHGLEGGALAHVADVNADGEDVDMEPKEDGWKAEYTQWWLDFLSEKGVKGISKDTWNMFLDFVRTINSTFTNYDMEAAWPSTIDDFVEYAQARRLSN